jgi:hypothetical protein
VLKRADYFVDGRCKGGCKPYSSSMTVYSSPINADSVSGKRVTPPVYTGSLEKQVQKLKDFVNDDYHDEHQAFEDGYQGITDAYIDDRVSDDGFLRPEPVTD